VPRTKGFKNYFLRNNSKIITHNLKIGQVKSDIKSSELLWQSINQSFLFIKDRIKFVVFSERSIYHYQHLECNNYVYLLPSQLCPPPDAALSNPSTPLMKCPSQVYKFNLNPEFKYPKERKKEFHYTGINLLKSYKYFFIKNKFLLK
jgi:hypothetical protein